MPTTASPVHPSRTTQPSTTQPSTTQPSTTQPSTTQPSTTQPSTTQPSTTQPSTAQPSTTATVPARAQAVRTPDLGQAVHFLVTTTGANGNAGGTSLSRNGYYESFPAFADFGLTIDGAFALAATGTDDTDLRRVVDFLRLNGTDGSGHTADDWTGIGTVYASGGSIAKEAVLAEVTGYDPRSFGGHDLIAALDQLVCPAASVPPDYACAGAGNYAYASSVFSQSLGVIAQLRAGDGTHASAAIAYLKGLQNSAGAWPSLIPDSGDSDVDSTALAAMALSMLPTDAGATAAVSKAESWLAGRQFGDGGFPGTAGDSTSSAALAVQGLSLAGTTYSAQITRARTFLAGQQNSDGGFDVAASGPAGSDVRASTQAVSGDVGTSFATLRDDVVNVPAPPTSASSTRNPSSAATTTSARSTTTGRSFTPAVEATSAPVAAVSTTSAALASTGLNSAGLLMLAVALLAGGGGLLVLGRRRADPTSGRHR